MTMLLRFEVPAVDVRAVLDGLGLRGFAVAAGPRLSTQDVQVVAVEADPSDQDDVRHALHLLSGAATEVGRGLPQRREARATEDASS